MKTSTSFALKLAAAASVTLAGAALAHPEHGGEAREKIQVILMKNSGDGKQVHAPVREFRMLRGEGGSFTCPNGEETKIDESTGRERTKILFCGDDKLSSADRANKLEETLAKLRSEDHLSAEHKGKVVAALEEAIARLRAFN